MIAELGFEQAEVYQVIQSEILERKEIVLAVCQSMRKKRPHIRQKPVEVATKTSLRPTKVRGDG